MHIFNNVLFLSDVAKPVRRISQPPLVPPDEPEKVVREQSPARKPVSRIVHIINLVRPFTLGQLKQLLSRSGTLTDDGFWINSIKSHCYATVSVLLSQVFY
jgi:apoptotic chromatin condensation inducer in the nucleus